MNEKNNNRKQRKEEEEKVNKISDVKMAYIMYGKKVFIIPIIIAIILGAVIWGIAYNARKNNAPQETADNQKEQINYIWGEIKPGKKNDKNYTTVTSSDGIQVPVPTGYTASSASDENSVNGGFVIYEGTDAVTDSNNWEAQCNRNQYVWIPIADVSDMYWRDQTTGKKYGTIYTFSSSSYTKNATLKQEPQTTSRDIQSTYLTQYLNGMSREDFLMEMEIDFDKMLNSVATYGGYYIGRYQTGDLSQATPVVKRMNEDLGYQNWWQMWKKARKLSGTSAGVQMIWGIQWDETLKWLIDSGAKTYSEIASDSKSWGNYKNNSFTYYTNTSKSTSTKSPRAEIRIPSGAYEGANANNVFDLAGNVRDWTCESNGSGTGYGRYYRGGSYDTYGSSCPAAYRESSDGLRQQLLHRVTCSHVHQITHLPQLKPPQLYVSRSTPYHAITHSQVPSNQVNIK